MTISNFQRRAFLKTSAALAACAALSNKRAVEAQAGMPTTVRHAASNIGAVKVRDVKTYKLKDAIFVEVISDAGVSGWGEASPNNRHLVETFVHQGLKQLVINRNVWDAEPIWDDLFYEHHDLGPGGALTYAISGIDLALWDLKGKLAGLPVHKLLGGEYRTRNRAYASFGVDGGRKMTATQAARTAAKFVAQGFTAVKLRMQIRERNIDPVPDPTLEYARAVRNAIGDKIDFWVDINNGYTAARAIETGKRLRAEVNIAYYEEPVSTQNLRDLAQVVEAMDVPVIAGEKEYTRWQHRDLIEQGKVGIINPDVTKCGGLTEARKIAAFAQACSVPVMPHNTKPTFSTAAALHFAASVSNASSFVEFVDTDAFADLLSAMKNRIELRDGFLHLPENHGLGLEVDEARLKRLVVAT